MKLEKIRIDLQNDHHLPDIPDKNQFSDWVNASLQRDYPHLEQTIRITDSDEIQHLNLHYRGLDRPTNVLSFAAEQSEHLDYDYLGDLVICAELVHEEALQQGKDILAHWAHLVIHGMLHLQGYDHIDDQDAKDMEQLEIEILASLGHTNPYDEKTEDLDG